MKVSYNKTKHTYQHTYKNGNKKQKKIHHPAIKTVHGPLFMYKLNTKTHILLLFRSFVWIGCFTHLPTNVQFAINMHLFTHFIVSFFVCIYPRKMTQNTKYAFQPDYAGAIAICAHTLSLSLPLFLSISLYRVVSLFRTFIKQPI